MMLADSTGLASNPVIVGTIAAATVMFLFSLPFLFRRRRPRRTQPPPDQPRHVKVLPPQPRDDHGPYDNGAFTIGPDERNPQ